jgi:hypothetical protein
LTDLEKARALLEDGSFGNCILYSNGVIHTSKGQGISPMLEFLAAGINMRGFSAADTVAGKALALLFACAGISEVYAGIMSRGAVGVFERFEIRCVYGKLVGEIKNRANTDICPMERAVENISEPEEAYEVLKNLFNQLKLIPHAPNGL